MDTDDRAEEQDMPPSMDEAARLGLAIYQARQAAGISLRRWAKALGMAGHSGLTDYERGVRVAPADIVVASERIFGLPPGTLDELRVRALAERAKAKANEFIAARLEPRGLTEGEPESEPEAGGEPLSCLPRMLPRSIGDFTGREDTLHTLLGAIDGPDGRSRWPLVVLSGTAGVGKSTLALRAAHELEDRFGDGQLYADLCGDEGMPVDPGQVLATFLSSLGVPRPSLPDSLDGRIALYRSLVADRQLLVVLDNAADEAQLRHLIPNGVRCATLVTSRSRLGGLDGSVLIEVPPLTGAEAFELLQKIVGPVAALGERKAARAICEVCGNLPLAIRIASSRARSPWSLQDVAERLVDERRVLDELSSGDLEVRATINLSYRMLDPVAKRSFRYLSLLGGTDWPVWAMACLLDLPTHQVGRILERLADMHLVVVMPPDATGQRRYRLLELLGLHARELCEAEDDLEHRHAAVRRVMSTYLERSRWAETNLPGGIRFLSPEVARPDVAVAADPSTTDDRAWYAAEAATMVDLIMWACQLGWHDYAAALACAWGPYYAIHGGHDWQRTHRAALAACEAAGDELCAAYVQRQLAQLTMERGEVTEAGSLYEQALARFAAAGEERAEAYARRGLGGVRHAQGRHDEARELLHAARTTFVDIGDSQGLGWTLFSLAALEADVDEPELALRHLRSGLPLAGSLADVPMKAWMLHVMSQCARARNRFDEAERHLVESSALFSLLAERRGNALNLIAAGQMLRARGCLAQAEQRLTAAVAHSQEVRDPYGEARASLELGLVLRDQGRHELATRRLEQALDRFRRFGASDLERRASAALAELAATGGG